MRALPLRLCFFALLAFAGGGEAIAAPLADPYEEIELWLGGGMMMAVPLYFVLQAWFAFAWRGGWRIAAMLPLVAIAPAALWSLHALSHGSNLWPLTVSLLAPFGFVYLLLLGILRFIARHLLVSPTDSRPS